MQCLCGSRRKDYYSKLEEESASWTSEHILSFDASLRESQWTLLDQAFPLGSDAKVLSCRTDHYGLEYHHWFLVGGESTYLHFQGPDLYSSVVRITTEGPSPDLYPFPPQVRHEAVRVTDDIRQRILHVLGMNNFSMCLRNGEQVSNYVVRGDWVSSQMVEGGPLSEFFRPLLCSSLFLVNTFPSSFHLQKGTTTVLYSEETLGGTKKYKSPKLSYFVDWDPDAYKILLLGPIESQRHLVDVIFNQKVFSVSEGSSHKELCCIQGSAEIYDYALGTFIPKRVILVASLGFVENKEWDDEGVNKALKSRVSPKFKEFDTVFSLLSQDPCHLRKMLGLLGYFHKGSESYLRFAFIFSSSEACSSSEKADMRRQAKDALGLRDTIVELKEEEGSDEFCFFYDTAIFIGFPPEKEVVNSITGLRGVGGSWGRLKPLLRLENPRRVLKCHPQGWEKSVQIPTGMMGSNMCKIL